jgi:excisionase family DNA binding protein
MNQTAKSIEKNSPTLLDERAAAKVLGISPRVLWGLADAGQIPFIRIGPRLKRYDPQDLQEFVERNRRRGQPGRDHR